MNPSWLHDPRQEQPGDVTDRTESRRAKAARLGSPRFGVEAARIGVEPREFTIRIDGDHGDWKATVYVDGEWFADVTGPERHGVLSAATHYVLTA